MFNVFKVNPTNKHFQILNLPTSVIQKKMLVYGRGRHQRVFDHQRELWFAILERVGLAFIVDASNA